MQYDIKTAKAGDTFWECEYGVNIPHLALEDVKIIEDDSFAGGKAYKLRVYTGIGNLGKEMDLTQALECGAYGLKLYNQKQYVD